MRLKKIVACTVAATMVLGSLSMVSAATVTVTNEGWWDAWTPTYTISDGANLAFDADITVAGDYVFSSLNAAFVSVQTDGITAPSTDNYDGYKEYAVLRSDNYAMGLNYVEHSATYTGTDYLYAGEDVDYKTLLTGSHYDINITREGTDVQYDYVITESDGTVLNCGYSIDLSMSDLSASDDIYVFFTADAGVTFSITECDMEASTDSIAIVTGNTSDLSSILTFYDTANNVTYASDNTDVATVDTDGVITAVSEGKANITVASDNNSVTIAVTVSDKENPVTGITASADSTDLTVGDTTSISTELTIDTTIADVTTDTVTYEYASSDDSVLTVDENGTVTAVAEGTATVTVTVVATHMEGSDTYTATVDFTVTEAVEKEPESESEEETEEEPEETTVTMDEQTITGDGNYWSVSTEHLQAQSKTAVWTFTVTVDALSDEYDNVIGLELQDADGQYISTGSNGDNWYFNTEGGDIVMDGAAFDLVAGQTYTITVERDGADITISYCDADGNVLLSYYCANTSLVSTVDAYVYAQGGVTLTVSGECTYGAASSGDEDESEEESEEAGSTTDGTTTGSQTGDVLPIVAVLVALCGCAIILVASKKRRA